MSAYLRVSPIMLALALACAASPAPAQSRVAPDGRPAIQVPRGQGGERAADLEKLSADVVRTTREYRASLERLLEIYQRDVATLSELVELRRELRGRDVISQRELEVSEGLLAEAEAKAAETRRWIVEADRILLEAEVSEQVAKLPPLASGGYFATPTLIRFNGSARWGLADTAKIQRFFVARFGQPLPISAFGQTAAHNRIGFDHRDAIDVAVHPDSAEGQGLMDYLRSAGIPFLAFRRAVAGEATGAHVHIGQPSRRITARR
ncbi:MAG: hypothetical protein HYV93_21280 [Candidatus Rokubacteria bacterium]|nr:hypothetical protein [Candidatus Rokubacteria bacterium]